MERFPHPELVELRWTREGLLVGIPEGTEDSVEVQIVADFFLANRKLLVGAKVRG